MVLHEEDARMTAKPSRLSRRDFLRLSAPATTTPTTAVTLAFSPLPEIIRFYPSVPSCVVQTHHSGVWSDKTLVPGALRQMLDASITRLTGLNDVRGAWAALSANLRYTNSWPYWREDWFGDSIFMSFDSVAHDTLGLQLLTRELEKAGGNPASQVGMAVPALQYAVELGLGANDPADMDVQEQTII